MAHLALRRKARTIRLAPIVLLGFALAVPALAAPAPPQTMPAPLWLTPLSACSGDCIGPNELAPVQMACDFQDPPLTAQQCCNRARQLACPAGYTFHGSCYDASVEIAC